MVFTNFPNGATSFGVPMVGGQLPTTQGTYWFVSSTTGSAGNPGDDISLPFARISSAITAASSGDVIVLLPNHAETIIAAGGVTVNKVGLTVIGMGEGSARPTFTFGTSTAATFLISSASFCMYNVVGICAIDSLVTGFDVRAADCTLGIPGKPIEWRDTSSTVEALRAVLTTAAADRLSVNLVYLGFPAGNAGVNAVRLVGVNDGTIVVDYYGICTTAVVEFVTTACTNIQVSGYFYVSGTTNLSKNVVDTVTGSTWSVQGFDGAAGTSFTGGSAAAVSPGEQAGAPAQQVVQKAAATMVNGQTIFTVAGGPIRIISLASVCVTANDGTASTLQYSITPTIGSATTISAASASLASAAAGASVVLAGTTLATAALLNANGPNIISNPGTIFCPAGTITMVIAVGSTTGTWRHFMRYEPLAVGVTVS